MKKIYATPVLFFLSLVLSYTLHSQCAASSTIGSASNLFTKVINSTSSIAADKNLNTIVFIHRNNATLNGGNSGQLRYDVSTNGGSTWTIDQGLLNPLTTNLARYPNVAIYNPSLNVTPSNAYVGYMGATINNASAWNGNVTGVRQLNNTGNTEFYNQPNGPLAYIPRSLTKGAPGIFWALDAQWGTSLSGFNVYKGTWNSSLNDIVWATNFTVTPPFNTSYANFAYTGIDYNIAFDPTGTFGWFSFLGHVSPGPANYAYYPVFYKTTNGGTTWTGPITADLNTFTCLTGNVASGMPSTNLEHDLVVDMYGNPHLITTILAGNNNYTMNYNGWHHMYDITYVNGMWAAYDLGNVNGAPGSFGTSPNIVTQYQAPQAARSADGSKVFFTWVDNSAYSQGAANTSPNLFGKAFDVVNKQWTNIKDFTSCNAPIAGSILFPHIADEVLEPNATTFKLATAYGQMTANDPAQIANFRFLDNITFTTTEFSIAQPSVAVSIAQGSAALACSSGSINLNLSGIYGAILWSNGSTLAINPVSTPGVYTVTALSGCNVGTNTISVSQISSTVTLPNSVAYCEGTAITLTVAGAATSYTWLPSNTGESTVTVIPTLSSTYSIQVFGDGCSDILPIPMTISPAPTLTVTGTNTVCLGSSVSQSVSGAQNYLWIGEGGGNVVSLSPTVNTTYTVFGTDANLCISSKTITINVFTGPTIIASSTKTLICKGQTTTLTANGAGSYTVTSATTTTVINSLFMAVTPTVTSTYTFTGQNNTGCKGSATITVNVSDCTGIPSAGSGLNNSLVIYPNPNNGEFTISSEVDLKLNMVNELGQIVKTLVLESVNEHKVSVNGLAEGIYFITGASGNTVFNQKIVISK